MQVPPVSTIKDNLHFGLKINSRQKPYLGYPTIIDTAIIHNKICKIYTAYQNNEIVHKLYSLTDTAGNWLKSKLKLYENGKIVRIIRSERK